MRFAGSAKKLTALKEDREGIFGQKAYLESIMSSMTDALIVINPDATLRSVNKAALDLLGYKKDELIGQPVERIFLQVEKEEERILHKLFQRIINAGVVYNIGLTFLTRQGKGIPINFSGAAMQQDGKIIGIVGVARDMRQIMAIIRDLEEKERKLEEHGNNSTQMHRAMLHMMEDLDFAKKDTEKAEQALKKTNEELRRLRDNLEIEVEKKIKEIRLVQDKLARSERLAALGQFAGAIGHEFRNQLGVIRNVAYFLKVKLADEDDLKIIKHLDILEEEIINTDNTIENLLAFARTKKPELRSVDIKELLLASIEMCKVPKRITVATQIDNDPPVIEADSIKLSRVFVNIILNSVEAIKETGQLLIRETRKGNDIDIRIEDNGSGIGPEDKLRIFEPTFTTKPRGTGLGLATAKAFIESHNGAIDIESEAGKGTAVIIRLPIKQRKDAA